jgi:DNA-binding NarL/FixJ family response regulator
MASVPPLLMPRPSQPFRGPERRREQRRGAERPLLPDGSNAAALPTRVVIVDDHASFADALAIAIDAHADLQCVGTASTLGAALGMLATARPDVVLMDVLLPDGNGIDAIPQVIQAVPGARVLVLTGHTDVDLLSRAAGLGASGFLPKESPVASVIGAVRAAVSGQMLVDGATLASILVRLARGPAAAPAPAPDVPVLTNREADVLALMGQGMDPHAIAKELGISLNTCRGYQKTLMAKLGAHSQLEAVVIGTRKGLLAR